MSAIDYLGKDAFDDKSLVKDFASKLELSDIKDLDMASKYYPLWIKTRVSEIIDEIH